MCGRYTHKPKPEAVADASPRPKTCPSSGESLSPAVAPAVRLIPSWVAEPEKPAFRTAFWKRRYLVAAFAGRWECEHEGGRRGEGGTVTRSRAG